MNQGEAEYWVATDGNVKGPYSFEVLVLMWERNELKTTDQICQQGTESWTEVSKVVHALTAGAKAQAASQTAPDSYKLVCKLTALLPIIGIIAGIVWALDRKHSTYGLYLLGFSLVVTAVYWVFLAVMF